MASRTRSRNSRTAFTLVEMLLCLVVLVPLVYGATLLTLAAMRASNDERVLATFTLPGQTAPMTKAVVRGASRTVETDAVIFHAALSQVLARSTATYVFGAENLGVPATSLTGLNLGPLNTSTWKEFETTNRQRTPREFLDAYGAQLGAAAPFTMPDNYSLVVVGPLQTGPRKGNIAVAAIAQVVAQSASVASKGERTDRATVLWARLWTDTGYYEYAWVLAGEAIDVPAWKPKALQSWLRADDARQIYEPGPAFCWFPDPVPASEATVGTSRFSYVF